MKIGKEPWPIVVAIYVVGWVGLDLLTHVLHPPPGISPWYPGAGLTVTLLYRYGLRFAPALVLAEIVRWYVRPDPTPLLAVVLVGIVVAVVYGAMVAVMRDRLGVLVPFRTTRNVVLFCSLVLTGSGIAALASAPIFLSFHIVPETQYFSIARTFWLGDAIGILSVAPVADFVVSALRGQIPKAFRLRIPALAEIGALVAVAVLGVVAFGALRLDPGRLAGFALTFVPVAFLAARNGMRGAVLGASTLDFTFVATDAALRPGEAAVSAGQLDAIVQTIIAFGIGALSASRARHISDGRWLRSHDPRTELPNRTALETWFAGDDDRKAFVACVQLDAFRPLDASVEADTSRALLLAAAERIASAVPEASFLGSLETEAFVVAHGGSERDARDAAERMLAAFATPLLTEPIAIRLTASIGLAYGADRRALVVEALSAMHEAHASGGNRIETFTPPAGLPRGTRLIAELVRARDRGEFVLHYQPIHRLTDQRIEGFEALIRWRHPRLGLLPPAAFLPALDRSAMLDEVEQWVVREAIAALARAKGHPELRVWINVSGRAAFDDRFVDQIPLIARAAGIAPQRIVIEVTEDVVMRTDRMALMSEHLRGYGIGVAVDDFGVGHSTIDRVRSTKPDFLKIDRSYAIAVADDERARGIAESILDFGRRVDAEVVAEGLETTEQIAIFRAANCALGQGYGMSRPMSEAALTALLA